MNPIAQRIREARLKAGLSEKQLAKKCGLSASYIEQIEAGRKIINEAAAANILKVFGETVESAFGSYLDETPAPAAPAAQSRPAAQPAAKPAPRVSEPVQVEANDQWAGALSGIIKRFPVTELHSGKAVAEKELPVLNKRIEDIPWEKLLFIAVNDDEAQAHRIRKGDILWVRATDQVQQEGLYIIERQSRRQVALLKKEYGQLQLLKSPGDKRPETLDAKGLKIVGKCVRAEFAL